MTMTHHQKIPQIVNTLATLLKHLLLGRGDNIHHSKVQDCKKNKKENWKVCERFKKKLQYWYALTGLEFRAVLREESGKTSLIPIRND